MRTRLRRSVRLVSLALVCVMFFAWALPAQALLPGPIIILPPIIVLPPIFFIQGISGTVTDAGTSGPIQGIIVSAFKDGTGEYISSGVTNAAGAYSLWGLASGDYNLRFKDPTKKYGEQWYFNQANAPDSSAITVTTNINSGNNVQLKQAATIKVVVRRAGHALTRLSGKALMVQQKADSSGVIQPFDGVTNSKGYSTFAGLRPTNVKYKESAIDPKGWFYSADATSTFLPYVGGTSTTVYIDMILPAGSSRDVTVSVPASKSSPTHGVRFTVSGNATRRIASTKMRIRAEKGSTVKWFSVPTVNSGTGAKYAGKIRLNSKGTWKLFAVFPGNSNYATTDSVGSKTVTVK